MPLRYHRDNLGALENDFKLKRCYEKVLDLVVDEYGTNWALEG